MPKESKKNRVVRVPDSSWLAAKARAEREGDTVSNVVRGFLDSYGSADLGHRLIAVCVLVGTDHLDKLESEYKREAVAAMEKGAALLGRVPTGEVTTRRDGPYWYIDDAGNRVESTKTERWIFECDTIPEPTRRQVQITQIFDALDLTSRQRSQLGHLIRAISAVGIPYEEYGQWSRKPSEVHE